MKTLLTIAAAILLIGTAVSATAPENIVTGVYTVHSNTNWAGFSSLNLISGSTILPTTAKQMVFYIAFTGGTNADISNMVLYTTAPNAFSVTSTKPVTLGGSSHPSLNLTSTSVCPIQPVSTTNPCVVRLDPVAVTPSPLVDYYLVTYFDNDTNNQTLSGATPATNGTTLSGYVDSKDDTQLAVGQQLPTSNNGSPSFLVAVMTE